MSATCRLLAAHDWPERLYLDNGEDGATRCRDAEELGIDLEDWHHINWLGKSAGLWAYQQRSARHYSIHANLPHGYVTGEQVINNTNYDILRPGKRLMGAIVVHRLTRYFLPGSKRVTSPRDVRLRPTRAFREMTRDLTKLQVEPPKGRQWRRT